MPNISIQEFRKIIESADLSVIKKSFHPENNFLHPENFSEYNEMADYCVDNNIYAAITNYRGLRQDKLNNALQNGIAPTSLMYLFKDSFVDQMDSNYHALQRRIQQANQTGNPELNRDASNILSRWPYPRYYLYFETVNKTVSHQPDTGPDIIELTCPWFCCTEHAPGQLTYEMFVDLSGNAPSRFRENILGDTGPIFVYSQGFEKDKIRELSDLFPEYDYDLWSETSRYNIENRVIDLLPLTALSYYHPEMHGSWSLKAVLATIAPDMNEDRLKAINDRDAKAIYRKILHPNIKDARKQELTQDLLDYYKLKTLSMVRLTWFLQGCDIWTFLPCLIPGTQSPLVSSEAPAKPDPLLHKAEEALRQYCLEANTKIILSPKSYLQEKLKISFGHASSLMNHLCIFSILSQHQVLNTSGNFSPPAAAGTVMSPLNTQRLFSKFHRLYRRREAPQSVWWFECGDGWFDLIWNLSKAIELEALARGIYPYDEDWPEVIHVKQKYGSLDFCLAKDSDGSNALIKKAHVASKKICEVCSAPASLVVNADHGLKTLCADHTEELFDS